MNNKEDSYAGNGDMKAPFIATSFSQSSSTFVDFSKENNDLQSHPVFLFHLP